MKKSNKRFILTLALIMALASFTAAFAAIPDVSSSFYAADYADVIAPDTESYIVSQNALLEERCEGAQIVVLTVDFLDGMNIEDYCYKVFNDWEIGDDKEDNGILLLLTIGEENYWCMQGKGLESNLSAGMIDDILWYYLEEDFAAGDYDSGVRKVFDALIDELCNIYGVYLSTGVEDYDDYNNNFIVDDDYYYEGDYYGSPTIFDWIITFIVFIVIILIVVFIWKLIRSAFGPASQVQPYDPYRPYTRPARRVYIPTPVHRPYRPAVPPHRPASSRPSSSSFGGGMSHSSHGMGHGGGGMSRGGGAGRRGR